MLTAKKMAPNGSPSTASTTSSWPLLATEGEGELESEFSALLSEGESPALRTGNALSPPVTTARLAARALQGVAPLLPQLPTDSLGPALDYRRHQLAVARGVTLPKEVVAEAASLGCDFESVATTCLAILMGRYAQTNDVALCVWLGTPHHRSESTWNWLDLVLVILSLFGVVFSDAAYKVGFMRSLRLCKLAKVLRVFRTIRFFSELRLMFDCVLESMVSLVWCFAMVVFIAYVFSLLIVQGLAAELREPHTAYSGETEAELLREFGSVGLGMMSLLKSTTGGHDWGPIYELLRLSDGFVPVAFVAYIVFFALAAWNIVTSLFVERALKIAQPDTETLALEQNMQDIEDTDELTRIFAELDVDHSGTISMVELQSIMHNPKFRSYLRVRGIDIQDARFFYRMMQSVVGDAAGDIDLRFVVSACLRMKGVATSMDLHALTFESKLLSKKAKHHIESVRRSLAVIEDRLKAIMEDRNLCC